MEPESGHEPNPYEAPLRSEAATPLQPPRPASKLNYPGGLVTALAIGLLGGIFSGICWVNIDSGGSLMLPLLVLLWVGSFGLVGFALPGTTPRRWMRAVIAACVSIPCYLLHIPVCGVALVVSMGPGGESGALIFTSVVAFTSVLVLFAWVFRTVARSNDPDRVLITEAETSPSPIIESESSATPTLDVAGDE
ncbi:MAG: hypothetical protein AAGA03_00175 [Planctomycetota bacterium]